MKRVMKAFGATLGILLILVGWAGYSHADRPGNPWQNVEHEQTGTRFSWSVAAC